MQRIWAQKRCKNFQANPLTCIHEGMNFFELFLISMLSIAAGFFLIIIYKSRRFHSNLSLLFGDMVLHFYQYLIGRLLLLSYQLGILTIRGFKSVFLFKKQEFRQISIRFSTSYWIISVVAFVIQVIRELRKLYTFRFLVCSL